MTKIPIKTKEEFDCWQENDDRFKSKSFWNKEPNEYPCLVVIADYGHGWHGYDIVYFKDFAIKF